MPNPAHGEPAGVVRFTYESTHLRKGAHALKMILEALAVRREGVRPLASLVDDSCPEHQPSPRLRLAGQMEQREIGGLGKDEEPSKV